MMYKIDAVIREEQREPVKAALHELGVNGVTLYQVMGFGAQRGYTTVVRGQEIDVMILPKLKLEIVVPTEEWKEKTIQKLCEVAYTGEVGDGKIFAYPITDAVKIRTGETGCAALHAAGETEQPGS